MFGTLRNGSLQHFRSPFGFWVQPDQILPFDWNGRDAGAREDRYPMMIVILITGVLDPNRSF
jgi:hypothetical protein